MHDGTADQPGAAVDQGAIRAAHRRIAAHVRQTPVLALDAAEFGLAAAPLTLKLEFLQHAGSFKARGAFNSLTSQPLPAAGVVAASGGNHGAAVAFAARRLGVPATIFVPEVASPAKLAQIRSYGAELVVTGQRYAEALAASEAHVAASGALAIHAYDQPATMAGQGTVGLELEQQAPDIDTLLVAVGGGGLIAGIAAWYGGRVKVVGVEPEAAPTMTMALAAGRPVDAPAGGIAADSLAPRQVGRLVFPLMRDHGAGTVLVEDAAILAAQKALWQVLRVVAEPGGAAALAALLSGRYRPAPGERVGVLVCGANTTAVSFDG
ncbi:MAG: threonine/serine dehydratase [Thalassobaculales bacterium]